MIEKRISYLILIILLVAVMSPLAAQSRKKIRQARSDLQEAVSKDKVSAFLDAMEVLLRLGDEDELELVVESFGEFVEKRLEPGSGRYFRLFSEVARALGDRTDKADLKELHRLRVKAKRWPSRLIVLEAATSNEKLDLKELCLEALSDKGPVVVQRALHYLRNVGKDLPVVEKILERYLEIDGRDAYRSKDWDGTRLGFRDALTKLLHVNLQSALDYKNYFEVRRDSPNLFDPPPTEGRSRLTLFGTEVTGKNVVFVLDRSASMRTTDKVKIKRYGPTGKTRRRGDKSEKEKRLNERRRITRAKKELVKVVKNLPEDMTFNLITYSSHVEEWKSKPARALGKNKKRAVKWLKGIEADGVTVTDLALDAAFSDLTVDTIYLITDGAPTHHGGRGGKELPRDSRKLMKRILKSVSISNFLRGVRIFTLGFPEAEEKFLKKLAKRNSGTYTAIR